MAQIGRSLFGPSPIYGGPCDPVSKRREDSFALLKTKPMGRLGRLRLFSDLVLNTQITRQNESPSPGPKAHLHTSLVLRKV